MNLPGRIFAVGGAGKAIAMELLESEWVLKEILEPKPDPASVTITILDTAVGEQNKDRQRLEEIRERRDELANELREESTGRPGSLTIDYKLITDNIQLNSQNDLLGDRAVPRITQGNGMKEEDWWLEDSHINENLDFARGVVRKRGLGKAIYYKAYAEDDDISTYIDLPDKGKVAVLAGLGGGTGSGIVMDLAQHLQDRQQTAEVTLFGILPNHTEGVKECTNAFAALSELEYLSLTDQQVFKDRILLPIDPTGFDGKTGNRIQSEQMLQELDEAMIYLLGAYYNNQDMEDPFSGGPKFAPFTIGVPQILRYNVEAINEARTALRNILNLKQDSLQAEEEIYTQIERYLAKNYNDDQEGGLRDLDTADLNERLDKVEDLLDNELFEELEYESLGTFREIVADARQEADDIEQQIDIVAGSLRAIDVGGQSAFVDDIDEHLAEILGRDLRAIAQRKNIFKELKIVDDSRVRDTIEYLIGSGTENANPGVKLQRLEAQLDDLETKRERTEEELAEAEQELEKLRDEQADEIQRRVQNWKREVESSLDQLRYLDNQPIHSEVQAIQTELEQFRNQVAGAGSPAEVEQVSPKPVRDQLNSVEELLNRAGIDFDETRSGIESAIADLPQARSEFIRANQEEGTVEGVLPWKSSTEEERQEGHKNYRMQKNRLDDSGIFSLGPPSGQFRADIEFNPQGISQQVSSRRDYLQQYVTDQLIQMLDSAGQEYVNELETELQHDFKDAALEDIARRAFRSEVEGTSEIEGQKKELETELQETDAQIENFQSTIDIFQNLNSQRDAYIDNLRQFNRERKEHEEEASRPVSTRDDDYVYVKNIQPEDVFRTTGDDDLEQSELFNSREENQRVKNNLQDLAENARDQQYTGLFRRKFSHGRARYDDLKIRVGVMSRAINQLQPDTLDFRSVYSGAYDLDPSGNRVDRAYGAWQHEAGDRWDIGMTVFIDGVFLDNIRKVVQADGYYGNYQRRQDDPDTDILIHHSYGLEKGQFIRRLSLLNLEDDDDIEFILGDEHDVVEDLLDDYIEVVDTKTRGKDSSPKESEPSNAEDQLGE